MLGKNRLSNIIVIFMHKRRSKCFVFYNSTLFEFSKLLFMENKM